MTIEAESEMLRLALATELGKQLGHAAPRVLSAWSRQLPPAVGPGVVMFARIHQEGRSAVVEASGGDGDAAFRRLVDRCRPQ